MKFESTPVLGLGMGINKELWIDEIIEMIMDLDPGDELIVYDYGEKGNLMLHAIEDDDKDIRIFTDWCPDDGEITEVDETDYIEKNKRTRTMLKTELETIWYLKFIN